MLARIGPNQDHCEKFRSQKESYLLGTLNCRAFCRRKARYITVSVAENAMHNCFFESAIHYILVCRKRVSWNGFFQKARYISLLCAENVVHLLGVPRNAVRRRDWKRREILQCFLLYSNTHEMIISLSGLDVLWNEPNLSSFRSLVTGSRAIHMSVCPESRSVKDIEKKVTCIHTYIQYQ